MLPETVRYLAHPDVAYQDVLHAHRWATSQMYAAAEAETPNRYTWLKAERERLAHIAWAIKRMLGK